MSRYVFPGYPAFLEAAEAELGLTGSAGPARRIAPLADLANLCAQAAHGDPSHSEGILARAVAFRDQIATALRAAELMLAEVAAGPAALGVVAAGSADPRPAGKPPRTPRGQS